MKQNLLTEVEQALQASGLGEHRFGILAARNGRLIERLRNGGRIWPETEEMVRQYLAKMNVASAPSSEGLDK